MPLRFTSVRQHQNRQKAQQYKYRNTSYEQDDGSMENRRMIVQADGMQLGEMEVMWTVDLGLSQATPLSLIHI